MNNCTNRLFELLNVPSMKNDEHVDKVYFHFSVANINIQSLRHRVSSCSRNMLPSFLSKCSCCRFGSVVTSCPVPPNAMQRLYCTRMRWHRCHKIISCIKHLPYFCHKYFQYGAVRFPPLLSDIHQMLPHFTRCIVLQANMCHLA